MLRRKRQADSDRTDRDLARAQPRVRLVARRSTLTAIGAIIASIVMMLSGVAPANAAGATNIYISVMKPPGVNLVKVLDNTEWSVNDRTPAQLWALRISDGRPVGNQRWDVIPVKGVDSVYELKNRWPDSSTGKCLDKRDEGADPNANGTVVQQYTCVHTATQRWQFIRIGSSNWGLLRNLASGRCLDVTGGSAASNYSNGRPLQVWDCNYSSDPAQSWNQRWNIF